MTNTSFDAAKVADTSPQYSTAVWDLVLAQLTHTQMVPLAAVNRQLRALVIPKLYGKAILSEWKDEGLKFCQAIAGDAVCRDTVQAIRKIDLALFSRQGAKGLLRKLVAIRPKLEGLETIFIFSYWYEDAIYATNLLARHFDCKFELRCKVSASLRASSTLSQDAQDKLRSIEAPTLFVSILRQLSQLEVLIVENLIHAEESPVQSPKRHRAAGSLPMLETMHLSYSDWEALGQPSSKRLELDMAPNYLYRQHVCDVEKVHVPHPHISISNSLIEELKLLGVRAPNKHPDTSPNVDIVVSAQSLISLIVCNIDSFTAERMLSNLRCPALEFVSVMPVSAGALRGLLTSGVDPNLCMAFVTDRSFEFKTSEEVSQLVQWLQRAASQFPVDVRDSSGSIERELYFGDGLWRHVQQTAYTDVASRAVCEPL